MLSAAWLIAWVAMRELAAPLPGEARWHPWPIQCYDGTELVLLRASDSGSPFDQEEVSEHKFQKASAVLVGKERL